KVVGSCVAKNTVRRSCIETLEGSNVIRVASACPVVPVHTCSYVGFSVFPPVYPGSTDTTPLSSRNTASVHQKHPPAKTIVSFICQEHNVKKRHSKCNALI